MPLRALESTHCWRFLCSSAQCRGEGLQGQPPFGDHNDAHIPGTADEDCDDANYDDDDGGKVNLKKRQVPEKASNDIDDDDNDDEEEDKDDDDDDGDDDDDDRIHLQERQMPKKASNDPRHDLLLCGLALNIA